MLSELIRQSRIIINKANRQFDRLGLSWSTGKDSTLCLYLIRELGLTVPVIFTDTRYHFPETIGFRDKLTDEWKLDLHIAFPNEDRVEELFSSREKCCHLHKTVPFLKKIEELHLDAVIVGIRKDEHEARANETYFSPRENPHHVRVHPILDWTWEDVLTFTVETDLPVNPLYSKGYTSLGCKPCTKPNPEKEKERAGRDQDKERIIRYLRELGYF